MRHESATRREGSQMLQVHHKIIDFNRDARQAGTGDSENKVRNLQLCNMWAHVLHVEVSLIRPGHWPHGSRRLPSSTKMANWEVAPTMTWSFRRPKCEVMVRSVAFVLKHESVFNPYLNLRENQCGRSSSTGNLLLGQSDIHVFPQLRNIESLTSLRCSAFSASLNWRFESSRRLQTASDY